MNNPLVSIVILNWNGDGLVQECLASIRASEYSNIDLVVVDNGSTDGSLSFLEQQQGIRLIRNPENYGFAKGNNIGLANARGKYIVLLNNDITVDPSWLNEPIRYLENDDRIGIISCRQMNYYHRDIIDGLYHYLAKTLIMRPCGEGERYKEIPEYAEPGFVISANGGSMILRKALLDIIGFFDERFFAYFEDADLAMRALLNSWKCLYVPQAIVYHKGSASFNRDLSKRMFFTWRNRYFFLYKYFPATMIMRNLRWIAWNEWRTAGRICIKMKNAPLYVSIWIAVLTGLRKFTADRKKYLFLFALAEKEVAFFAQHKIRLLRFVKLQQPSNMG